MESVRERITTPLNLFSRLFGVLAAMAFVGVMATANMAAEGDTTLVSVDASGNQANGASFSPSISSQGRFVAFASSSWDLVPYDTNEQGDVFVRDRHTGTTERVNVRSSGEETKAGSSNFLGLTRFREPIRVKRSGSVKGVEEDGRDRQALLV